MEKTPAKAPKTQKTKWLVYTFYVILSVIGMNVAAHFIIGADIVLWRDVLIGIIASGLLYAFGEMESFNKTNRLPPPPDMVGCGYHGTSGCDGNCASCASAPKRDPRRSLEGRG